MRTHSLFSRPPLPWLIAWFAIGFLLTAGALLPPVLPMEEYNLDKICHIIGGALLTFIPCHILAHPLLRITAASLIMLGCIGIELIQPFFPPHFFSWADILVDLVGILIGATVALVLQNKT